MGSTFMLIIFIVFLVFLVPTIFYLITLQKTLEAISPENRKMAPGQVWLLLIPLFNFIWQFIVVSNISDSIRDECYRLGVPVSEDRPTYNVGLAKNILGLCGFIPVLGTLFSIASLICWILYWVKVNEYKNLIVANKDNDMLDAERGVFHNSPQP